MRPLKDMQETNNFKEEMNMRITYKSVKASNEVFVRLNCLRRWTQFVTEGKYNELAKQALNCITAFILGKQAENEGKTIIWERFPKIAIYRAFQKAHVNFDTPEFIIDEICKVGNIPKDVFDKETMKIISEETDEGFAEYISGGVGTYEAKIYKAASKIATYIELLEIQHKINGDYLRKHREIIKSLETYEDIPAVKEIYNEQEKPMFEVLKSFSKLRNQNRWAICNYNIECSVLGHLFDTAVWAYFMSLEQEPENERLATKMFFMGIFHDVAENWTKDIPSPIKDRIPGFRKATETYEDAMMEEHVYKVLPQYIADALKELRLTKESEHYTLIKGADYLSADSECYRQLMAGTRDSYFLRAILKRQKNIDEGKETLTPMCRELYKYFVRYGKGLNL